MIELGDEVRDLVTGFQGIATARIVYLVGCQHIGVTPKELHEGVPRPVQWIDEPQLEVVRKQAVEIPVGYEPEPPKAGRTTPIRRVGGSVVVPRNRKETP